MLPNPISEKLDGLGALFRPTVTAAAGPAVVLGSATGNLATGATQLVTVNITVASQANRAMVAMCCNDGTKTVNGIGYTTGSGGAWAKLGTMTNGDRLYETWSSIAPSTGAVTIQGTYSANIGAFDGVITLFYVYNADQTTPATNYTSSTAAVVTLAVPITSGGLALVNMGANADPGAITAGTQDYSNAGNSFWRSGHNGGTGTATVAWTTAANGRGLQGCNVKSA